MLLRHRTPDIDATPARLSQGLGHVDQGGVVVLRWLNLVKVDFIVVGPVAHAIRGDLDARGPVAIVPAPYGRNYERLTNALVSQNAGLRRDRGRVDGNASVPVKLTADKLARGRRWLLHFSGYDLDVEGAGTRAAGTRGAEQDAPRTPRYQELLYEAARFELAEGVSVEVASPEDLEHFSHVRRTGTAPEFRVTRNAPETPADAPGESEPPGEKPAERSPEPGSEESGVSESDSSADA